MEKMGEKVMTKLNNMIKKKDKFASSRICGELVYETKIKFQSEHWSKIKQIIMLNERTLVTRMN